MKTWAQYLFIVKDIKAKRYCIMAAQPLGNTIIQNDFINEYAARRMLAKLEYEEDHENRILVCNICWDPNCQDPNGKH
jgi:hypothetical protein